MNAAANEELELSNGSIYRFCKDFAEKAESSIENLETEVLNHLLAERKIKRQNTDMHFRKDSGHEMYCAILTLIETLKRRKMGIIKNIKELFVGTPAIF